LIASGRVPKITRGRSMLITQDPRKNKLGKYEKARTRSSPCFLIPKTHRKVAAGHYY
jgi:hypothetical protein